MIAADPWDSSEEDADDTLVAPLPDMPELRKKNAPPKRFETVSFEPIKPKPIAATIPFEPAPFELTRDPLLGRVIAGKYRVEEKIGEGSMGAVYRATQLALEKTVAVKVLAQDVPRDPFFAERFRSEALAASRLDHPNSVRIYDFGVEQDGLLYLVMEHVGGRDLAELLTEEWPLDRRRVSIIVTQICAALAVAHEQGIIHRDLKPENILVVDGTSDDGEPIDVVRVCDFGIAKIAGRVGGSLATRGIVVGTPEYMSPEQARGDELDARSDLYSVGVILYQLLTGNTPFAGENPVEIALQHVRAAPVPPSQRVEGVDPELERVCLRALEKDRDARYPDARAMRLAVREALEARGSNLPPMATTRRPAAELPSFHRLPTPVPPPAPRVPSVPPVSIEPPRAWVKHALVLLLLTMVALLAGASAAWLR